MKLTILFITFYFQLKDVIFGQQTTNECSQYFRNVHRMGPNVSGRLEIPVDEHFPKYKLRIGFSSPIHHMSIRPTRAKDTGSHREFIVDATETIKRDGKMQLDLFIRLNAFFGHVPRMTRIVYNNVALCGDAASPSEIDESFSLQLSTAPTRRTPFPVLIPFKTSSPSTKDKDYGEEEDIF